MNILIVQGPYYPIPPIAGGATEKYMWNLGSELSKRGHSVSFLSRAWKDLSPKTDTNNLTIHRHGGFPQKDSLLSTILHDCWYAQHWLRHLPSHDLVISNDLSFSLLSKVFGGVKNLIVCLGRKPRAYCRHLNHARTIVVPSSSIREDLLAICNQSSVRVDVIGLMIDPKLYCPPTKKLFTKNQKLHFLYVGRIHPEKGLHNLIRAFNLLYAENPNCQLKILGPSNIANGGGGDSYFNALKDLGNSNIVFLDPEYDQKKLVEHLQWSDVFCYPSIALQGETFGVAILEAMACGAVPLVSNLPCFKDLVTHDQNGLVFDCSQINIVENILEALATCFKNPSRLEFLSESARASALNFSAENITNSFCKLFQQILGS